MIFFIIVRKTYSLKGNKTTVGDDIGHSFFKLFASLPSKRKFVGFCWTGLRAREIKS